MAEKHQISSLKTYLSSKESLWFWFSLFFIFSFFTFSWVTSENILILFIKRATTLIFAFIVPGYVITKAIYPKNEIDAIERFAFSVAFSVTFIMFLGYVLNYVWEITLFSFAVSTFLVMLSFAFTALLRDFNIRQQKSNDTVKLKDKISNVLPLLFLCTLFFIIQSYHPITNFNFEGYDPYAWSWNIAEIITREHLDVDKWAFGFGYPIGFPLIITFLSIFLDVRPFDIIRYIPIFSFLNIVPVYLLANYIFRSSQISLLSAALFYSTRWGFLRNYIGHPETFVHFLLIISLLLILKTIERPSVKNALITSFLLSSMVLEYHMPIQFLIVFLPSILLLSFLHGHFNKKSKIKVKEVVKLAFFVGIPLIMLSGLFWYFWKIDGILQHYLQRDTIYIYQQNEIIDYNIFSIINRTILKIGWLQTIFSFLGLTLLIQNTKSRGKFRYQFLVIYFFTLLLLSHVNYLGIRYFNTEYMFAYLILPVSLLSSYAFLNILNLFSIKRISKKSIFTEPKSYSRKEVFSIIIVFMLSVNFNGFNYFWVLEESSSDVFYKKDLVNKLNQREYSSLYFYQFTPASIVKKHRWNLSTYEFNAFKWLQKNTRLNSIIMGWGSYDTTALRAISERDVVKLYNEDLIDIPTSNLQQISKKISYLPHFQGRNTYIVVGLHMAILFKDKGPPFSKELEISIAKDPNFKLVYENPQVKIYKPEFENYAVFLSEPGGFREDFEDLFNWGNNLNEKNTLSTKNGIAIYRSNVDHQPIDVVFFNGFDTKIYPEFETKIKIDSGKISISVYDSAGKEHTFLRNYTTHGKWETYKLNLYNWLTSNGHETKIYAIKITNTLEGDSSFSTSLDWISIHNHLFWDRFSDESKITKTDKIRIYNGFVTLSKKIDGGLSNGGFENDFEGWIPGAKWGIDSEESHSGNKSAMLVGTVDPAKDSSAYLDTVISRGILKPKTQYIFSIWIKGNVMHAIRASVRQFGSANLWSSRPIFFSKDNRAYDNWTYHEEIITTPDDVNGDFHIRIYGGGDPAVWIDGISFGEDVYEPSGMFISTTTNTKNPIVSVTPTWNSEEPNSNVNITVEISVDNGTTWTGAENGATINYPTNDKNKNLLYRAFFQTNDNHRSPILHDIAIIYEEKTPEQ